MAKRFILFVKRRGSKMAVSDVRQQVNEVMNIQIQQEDLLEVLRQMEDDNLIQFNERGQTIFVKSNVII